MGRAHFGSHPRPDELWQDTILGGVKVVAADTETVSLKNREVVGIGVAVSPADAFWCTPGDESYEAMLRVLRDPAVQKLYHNAPFDLRVMRPMAVDYWNVEDTAVVSRLCGAPGSLNEASEYLHWFDQYRGHRSRGMSEVLAEHGVKTVDKLDEPVVAEKCCTDTLATFGIWEHLRHRLDWAYYMTERRMFGILEHVSQKGIKLDQARLEELFSIYSREFSYYKELCIGMGFNPGSRLEVAYTLCEHGAFLPFTKKWKQLATDGDVLRKVRAPAARPIAEVVLLYRFVEKMLSTYIRPLRGLARAYATFHLDAITSRVSSTSAGESDPDRNLSNIPKKVEGTISGIPSVRSAFVSDNGVLSMVDASQIEMRILAYLSHDPVMMKAYVDNVDIHSVTEQGIWGTVGPHRNYAKIFNYAMVYYADPMTVADKIHEPDVKKVSMQMNKWFETYPGAAQFMRARIAEGKEVGKVKSLYGRTLPVPIDMGDSHRNSCSINYPIQTSAAEIFKRQILHYVDAGLLELMINFVHDEVMFNGEMAVPEGIDRVSPVYVPVEKKVSPTWG